MQVVVTRPEREAKAWVQALSDAGHDVLALPLIAFESVGSPVVVSPSPYRALMFVSAQAVAAFFNTKRHITIENKAQAAIIFDDFSNAITRYWAPGPGTARALLQVGVPASHIDQPDPQGEQFDSEALWQVVQGQLHLGDRVLIVRGETEDPTQAATAPSAPRRGHGRDWLAQQCETAGASVDYAVVYRRVRPVWSDEQRHQAEQAIGRALWLFSNTEALGHLAQLLPQADWRSTPAVVTHPRVAQAAQALGFATITICRPNLVDVLAGVTCCRQRTSQTDPKMPPTP